jgi:hypothetical protein
LNILSSLFFSKKAINGSGLNSGKASGFFKEKNPADELNKQEDQAVVEDEDEFKVENLQSISEFDRNIQEGKQNKKRTQKRCMIYPDDRSRIWWDTFITV